MYGPLTPEESALIASLPVISRARGHRLYTADGKRWLDCWADGGRALAGHRPAGVSLRLKNEIERGLYAPYPNLWTSRLEKALLRLFPGYRTVRVYRSAERAFAAAGLDGLPADPVDIPPAADEGSAGAGNRHKALWGRLLLPFHPAAGYLFPILPVPGITDAQPVLAAADAADMPPSDPVSPVILAALTRSCGALDDSFPSLSFPIADIWERRGVYMSFRGSREDYPDLFRNMFANRVLIAPSPDRPSILPPGLSAREISVFAGRSVL